MSLLLAVLADCLRSGTLFVAFGALFVVPFVIWKLSRLAMPMLAEIERDRSRALVAGLLAIAPGASFAAGSVVVSVRAIRAGCLEMPGGRAVIAALAVLLALAFGRAVVRAWTRQRALDDLVSTAASASYRLRSVARPIPIAIFEILEEEPLIFVTGLRRPSVFVSSGALARLNDAELRAALAHEYAHARHADHAIMSALLFFTDLLPLDVERLTEIYRDSREFAADRAAIETADPLDLASAILGVASLRRRDFVSALADACVKARLNWLLGGAEPAGCKFPSTLKYLVAAQLVLLAGLTIAAFVFPGCRTV